MRKIRLFLATTLLLASGAARAQVGLTLGDAVTPIAGLTNTVVTVKAKQGIIDRLLCYNPNASVQYVQVFDTSGTVTVGTTAARFFVPLTPSATTYVNLGINMFNAIKVAGTQSSGGPSAPGSALPCSVTFR